MNSTLSKLQAVVGGSAQPDSPAPTTDSAAGDHDLVTSLEEQLNTFYDDLAYANQTFPNQSLRSILEWAVSQKQQAGQQTGAATPLSFVPAEVMGGLAHMTQETADGLDFGLVEVDDTGMVKIYNQYESQLAGVQASSTIGKNFFLQVAPCTNNKLFYGRFKNGVEINELEVFFNYTFTYKMRPTAVQIAMFREPTCGRNFVFVKRR